MSPFLDRSKRSDPHLEWKVRLFAIAAVLAVCGIYFEERWMTGAAIALLASAMLLRFLPWRTAGEPEHDARDDEAAGQESDEGEPRPEGTGGDRDIAGGDEPER